jgi:hypothetical protein
MHDQEVPICPVGYGSGLSSIDPRRQLLMALRQAPTRTPALCEPDDPQADIADETALAPSPLQRMGSIIPDPRLVAAIVDRLTLYSHIIETGTEGPGSGPRSIGDAWGYRRLPAERHRVAPGRTAMAVAQ